MSCTCSRSCSTSCKPMNVCPVIKTVDSTASVSDSDINVTIIPGTFQKFRIKYFAITIPAISLSPIQNYVLNVDVSYLDIRHGVLDIQLLPVSNTSQTTTSYMFVSGNYLDISNNTLQVYVYVATNSAPVDYNEPMILYVTYY